MAVWKQTVLKRAIVLCVTCHHSPNDINGPKAWRLVPRLADRWTLHYCMVHVYRMIETDLEGDKSRRKIFKKNMNRTFTLLQSRIDLCMCLGSSIQAVFLQLLGDEAEIP